MFSVAVTDEDAFLDMPASTQLLYFHLGMHGDDDGFVDSPKKIMRSAGCHIDDLKLLIAKGYIISFDCGAVVITDWKRNNEIKNDRYHPTEFKEELALLTTGSDKRYSKMDPEWIQNGSKLDPECIQNGDKKEKVSPQFLPLPPTERENREERTKEENKEKELPSTSSFSPLPKETFLCKPARDVFKKPTLEEVEEYCRSRNNGVDAQNFLDFYEMKGWMVGKNHMKDWKAAVRTWERRDSYGGNKRIPGDRTTGPKVVFNLPESF